MLARAPDVVLWVGVSQSIRALQHALDRLSRCLIERNRPLACLVLAASDIQNAFARRAFDVPHLFQVDVPSSHVLHLYSSHRGVGGQNGGAVHVLPLWIAGSSLEETLLFYGGERAADGSSTSFGQHLHLVLEPTPLLEAPEHLTQCSNIHVDRPIAGALEAPLGLKALDDLSRDGRKL